MKPLVCLFLLFFTSEIRSFDIIIEEAPESADLGELLKEFEPSLAERNKRSVLSDDDESEVFTEDAITLHSYKVESTITSHFVNTMIRSKVVNNAKHSQNMVFDIQVPKGAFINNFTMNVNGITFSGSIKEKSVARNLYSKARARGKAAGLMRTNSMDMENFKAELNVPPGSKVQFEIHYQEALRRKLGVYEHAVFIQPGRLARHLEVDIYITEPQGFSFVNVPKTITEGFAKLVKITQGDKKAHISFKPTLDEQRQCPTCSTTAVNGNLLVKYDVKREESSHLQVFNGYFLHFFAPDNLPTLPKNILFVIDVSGSMWGLKMKQTVDAMKSILEDLNSDDQFGIIDFNHNIRCWKDELVYASSVEKGDASKYVQRIQPNGGTNINDALLRAIFILKEASNKGLLEQNSVSLIVLVSDGDPTVGELKLPKIQKNVRTNIQDDIALHSLGIGFDVDYDFLERLAQENHGMAQRIYGNQDTAAQLKEFYNKVSTPLLKNIVVNYPMESVSDVTQNSFHNYFKGDEIVVAGKLKPESIPNLMSIVSASSANADLTYEVIEKAEELKELFEESKHAFPDFARQYWAQLTINQLLAERNLAVTAAAKRNITQTILQMSIDHHFVTPFTSLLIESENGNERMLADAPRDPKGGCCQTLVVNSRVPLNLPQPTPGPVNEELKRTSTEIYIPNGQKLVDNDPHFIINLPISQINVCFNIDSQPGSILNLVSDPKQGITVNGKIIAAKKAKSGKLNTYFGTIGMYFKKENMKVEISPEKITVKDASYSRTMSWSESSSMNQNGFLVSVMKNSNVTITVNENIRLLVILHQAWKKHPVNVDFLGLYIPNETKLSATTHGLIGQFRNEPEVSVYDVRAGTDPEKPIATMNINGEKFSVTRGTQKEYQTHPGLSTSVTCWFVHNNGKGFIDGHYKDYIVPQIYSFFKRH
ncbi:inter-alpha-trypsin inhibitor heavy chain 2 S homeolog precursor [Xenopus laevis]|uniref:Inter-alpha-trypsin inhibitor heavy chain 2 S homeolog precursor n=1 Tax=Xenopus laevis TaxID=8355 RepID=Q4FZX2_XENLA|nr:inter-alpha-trypsin inhibitor heavy chain 2 S homeolog precursor [Xenopus laevis]AAH98981.1 LOC495168 protein [Xenopus laevis]